MRIGVGEREILVLAIEISALAGKRDHVFAVQYVLLVFEVNLAYAWLVGVPGDGIVGYAHGNSHGTLLGAIANHLHHPHFILVGYGERLPAAGVAILVDEVCHHLYGLACGF